MFAGITFNVTTTADEISDNGQTSLREAILLANATPGTDTIHLSAGIYQLTLAGAGEDLNQTGDLDITESVSIIGQGSAATFIQAGQSSWNSSAGLDGIDRVFDVLSGSEQVDATFEDLAVQFGNVSGDGGGINYSGSGNLTLSHVALQGNSAAERGGGVAFLSLGHLLLTNCSVQENRAGQGAGVSGNGGSVEVNKSTIASNLAVSTGSNGNGGGIFAYSNLVLRRSTITANQAEGDGGGIYSDTLGMADLKAEIVESTIDHNQAVNGAGIYHRDVDARITNTTLSGNVASDDGGGYFSLDRAGLRFFTVLLNDTITLNAAGGEGGGIYYQGYIIGPQAQIALGNTIVAKNTATQMDPDLNGEYVSNGSNFVGDVGNSKGMYHLQNDIIGDASHPLDPFLGPLSNNGSGIRTHAPLDYSPVLDVGRNSIATAAGLTTDERGATFERISHRLIDIGAVERQVKTAGAVVAIGADSGPQSQPLVKVYDVAGKLQKQFLAYEQNFRGGVRVAVGDVTGDSLPEIVTAPGPGHSSVIKVFTMAGVEVKKFRIQAYSTSYTGGMNLAVGDVLGDGRLDVITGTSRGVATIRVFENRSASTSDPFSATPSRSFAAFGNNNLGGVVVAVGNITGSAISRDEVIVGSGPGTASTIKVYNVERTSTMTASIQPFAASYQGGTFVTTADFNNDGIDELLASGPQGNNSVVKVFNGANAQLLKQFTIATGNQNAVHFCGVDIDLDGVTEGIVAAQPSAELPKVVRYFRYANLKGAKLLLEQSVEFGSGITISSSEIVVTS